VKHSAGIMLYRSRGDIEILLVHASGYENSAQPWSVPKGLIDPGESDEDAARREIFEEVGIKFTGRLCPLGSNKYRSGKKTITCFAAHATENCNPTTTSWEIDAVKFFPLNTAKSIIHEAQVPFIDRLIVSIGEDQI